MNIVEFAYRDKRSGFLSKTPVCGALILLATGILLTPDTVKAAGPAGPAPVMAPAPAAPRAPTPAPTIIPHAPAPVAGPTGAPGLFEASSAQPTAEKSDGTTASDSGNPARDDLTKTGPGTLTLGNPSNVSTTTPAKAGDFRIEGHIGKSAVATTPNGGNRVIRITNVRANAKNLNGSPALPLTTDKNGKATLVDLSSGKYSLDIDPKTFKTAILSSNPKLRTAGTGGDSAGPVRNETLIELLVVIAIIADRTATPGVADSSTPTTQSFSTKLRYASDMTLQPVAFTIPDGAPGKRNATFTFTATVAPTAEQGMSILDTMWVPLTTRLTTVSGPVTKDSWGTGIRYAEAPGVLLSKNGSGALPFKTASDGSFTLAKNLAPGKYTIDLGSLGSVKLQSDGGDASQPPIIAVLIALLLPAVQPARYVGGDVKLEHRFTTAKPVKIDFTVDKNGFVATVNWGDGTSTTNVARDGVRVAVGDVNGDGVPDFKVADNDSPIPKDRNFRGAVLFPVVAEAKTK